MSTITKAELMTTLAGLGLTQPEEFITRAESADILKIEIRTLDRWVQKGRLRAYRVPGSRLIRFKRKEVMALLQPGGRM
jgi:excisionase family DNA binding protein